MKNLWILCFLVASTTFGQEEGYIKYAIEVQALDTNRELKQSAMMLRGSTMEMYFTTLKLRIDYHMGQVFNSTTILDKEEKKMLSLTSNMYGKYATILSDDSTSMNDLKDSSEVITVHREKTKTIHGFKCFLVISESQRGRVEYYCTEEYQPKVEGLPIVNANLPGFPMQFSKVENGILMNYQVSVMKDTVIDPSTVFALDIPVGYTVIANQ